MPRHARLVQLLLVAQLAGCPGRQNVPCVDNSNCDLEAGGVCTVNPTTGNEWCTYPDGECPSGRRWSNDDVGDGVSGTCVDQAQLGPLVIAFTSDRDGNAEIYLMREDGTGQTNLTMNAADDTAALWNPAGDRIAFLSNRSGTQELYVMNADGSSVLDVSKGQAVDAVWSPDGMHVAFTSNRTGMPEIFRGTLDGSLPLQLTNLNVMSTGKPTWSPDGNHIAFETAGIITVMNPDGSNAMGLSTGAIRGDHLPRWSPTGTKIAFARGLTFENWDVFIMNSGGGSEVDITTGALMPTLKTPTAWSPSGADLVGEMFDGNTGAPTFGTGICAIAVVAGTFDNIVLPPATKPCWSPDGMTVAYDSTRSGNSEIYVIARAGGTSTNLTANPGNDSECSWRPLM